MQVVRVLRARNEVIEYLTAVATGDGDGMPECFAQWVEYIDGKVIEVLDVLPRRIVRDAVSASCYGVKELGKRKVTR